MKVLHTCCPPEVLRVMAGPGRFQDSIDGCRTALCSIAHCTCCGLRCMFLCRRAGAQLALHNTEEALADCSAALSQDPAHVECLHLLTQVRSHGMGNEGPEAL